MVTGVLFDSLIPHLFFVAPSVVHVARSLSTHSARFAEMWTHVWPFAVQSEYWMVLDWRQLEAMLLLHEEGVELALQLCAASHAVKVALQDWPVSHGCSLLSSRFQ